MPEPATFQDTSPRHLLPLLFAAQAQKEVVVNEALSLLDAIVQPSILGEQDDPPADPGEGDCWIVGANAGLAWTGHASALASYSGGDWLFSIPVAGMRVWDQNTRQFIHFDGTWVRASAPTAPNGGSTIDSECRQAITALIGTLQEAGILPAA